MSDREQDLNDKIADSFYCKIIEPTCRELTPRTIVGWQFTKRFFNIQ